ncbi:MAG: TraB/GumN family protein [Alphaproteobacteria bacterium]
MNRRIKTLIAVACAITTSAAAPISQASAPQGPPLYVAERGTAKVYVLGACGPGDGKWLTPRIENALAESKELWREIPTEPMDAKAIAIGDKLGKRDEGSLFDDLTSVEAKRVLDMAAKLDIKREQLQPMKVWYAARIITFAFYAKAGKPVSGSGNPELVMSNLAAKQSKPVKAEYSSWEEFTLFFDRMPAAVQKQYLLYSLDDVEAGPDRGNAGDTACARGDVGYYEKNAIDFSERYPELYTTLNANRDKDWARRIDGFLAAGGTTFILVGINHTIGPDSIQVELRKAGIKARRVVN